MDRAATIDAVRLSGEMMRAGSKSFAAASLLFDPQTRRSVRLLYAWCRHCDDVIDGQTLGFGLKPASSRDPQLELARLRQQTTEALAGHTMRDPVFQGFQIVMGAHQIPARHAFEHLDGFAMDVAGRAYTSIDDTLNYCYHVAGVVGVMMGRIMGVRDDATLDRACDLGLGFQLTNIARDIVEDANAGRCYLPLEWLTEAGLTRANFAEPRHRRQLFGVVARLLATADAYYASSRLGLVALPLRSSWAVGTARSVYRRIGREILRAGPDPWITRVSTSHAQKLLSACSGAATTLDSRTRTRFTTATPRSGLWTRPKG